MLNKLNLSCGCIFNHNCSTFNKRKNKETATIVQSPLRKMPFVCYQTINFRGKKTFDETKSQQLGITNLHTLRENGVRGESLSVKKNKHFLPKIKDCGITQIIDLKTADFSNKFGETAKSYGLEYHHYPIDSSVTPTREIIDNLPSLFEDINRGNFYISCAQGMHRTDIAMALNYIFNPLSEQTPPVLYGHQTEKGLRSDDIMKRVNSVFRELNESDKEKLGLKNFDEEAFKKRKSRLLDFNLKYNKDFKGQ